MSKIFTKDDFKDPKVIKTIKAYVAHAVFTINQNEDFAKAIGSRILMVNQGSEEKRANVDIAEFKNGSVEVTVSRINNKFPLTNLRFVDRIDSKNIIEVEGEVNTKIIRKSKTTSVKKNSTSIEFLTSTEPSTETSVKKVKTTTITTNTLKKTEKEKSINKPKILVD